MYEDMNQEGMYSDEDEEEFLGSDDDDEDFPAFDQQLAPMHGRTLHGSLEPEVPRMIRGSAERSIIYPRRMFPRVQPGEPAHSL